MFVRFLFGVIGPIASELEEKKAFQCMKTELLFYCLYEAQNPEFVSKFIKSSQQDCMINHPLHLYVFGSPCSNFMGSNSIYIIRYASIQFG